MTKTIKFCRYIFVAKAVPRNVHLMAFTATATVSTCKYIITSYSLHSTYYVADKLTAGIAEVFYPIIEKLKVD